jgi:hypothetical protein
MIAGYSRNGSSKLAIAATLGLLACSDARPPTRPGAPPTAVGTDPAPASGTPPSGGVPPSGMAASPQQTSPTAQDAAVAPAQASDFPPSSRANLQWKRYAAFEADLSSALALPKEKLCVELGRENCVRGVHLAPLGGHDPFKTGLLESSAEPLATTPTVVERVVLSACNARIALDAQSKSSEVFGGIDLTQAAPAPEAAGNRALVTSMYRRLLGRDADELELGLLSKLAIDEQGQPVSARDFALSACSTLGTSTEFLFF